MENKLLNIDFQLNLADWQQF